MDSKQRKNRCQDLTKAGQPCGAAATAGGLCFFHANPNKASELGRIGGRRNRRAPAESTDPLPTLDNALAVRETVDRVAADLYAGRINPRIAAGLAALLNLQLRAIQITEITKIPELDRRLAKWEKASAEKGGPLKATVSTVGTMSPSEVGKDQDSPRTSAGLPLSSNLVDDDRESQ